uniref:WD_REPEATS_REGION domain-containing protein n=1 Tax=Caenorhabditis tropicalis TaxID=1561998 RepID=A0A1I7UXW1_9PELO
MTIFGGSQQKKPPLIGDSGVPAYALKKIGSRHILIAGGGGASKTGVKNEIQTHLFTTGNPNQEVGFQSQCVDTFDTETMATMNMDVACVSDEISAKYVIAAGQENICVLYTTRGFKLNEENDDNLSFNITKVGQFRSDFHANNSYQKCVRFDKNSRGKIFATGGADGYIRIWDAQIVFRAENRDPQPKLSIQAHKADVDDIDFSSDSKSIISVGAEGAFIWSTETGEQLLDVQFPIEISRGFKMRSVRCTPLGDANGNTVFVAAYNSISRGSKDQASYLSLWTFNKERKVARPIVTKLMAKHQSISSLVVSECGNFTAVGTMSGSVGVFDTHEFRRLYFSPEAHGLFVTGIEFVSKNTPPICEDITKETPGVASGFQTAVVTLAADKTMQLHRVPYPPPQPFSEFMFIISLLSVVFTWLSSFLIIS